MFLFERYFCAGDEPENSLKQHCEKLQVQWNSVWFLTLDRQKKLQEAKASAQKDLVRFAGIFVFSECLNVNLASVTEKYFRNT